MKGEQYVGKKEATFLVRVPAQMKEEVRRLANKDAISMNAVIVQCLARCIREERQA